MTFYETTGWGAINKKMIDNFEGTMNPQEELEKMPEIVKYFADKLSENNQKKWKDINSKHINTQIKISDLSDPSTEKLKKLFDQSSKEI